MSNIVSLEDIKKDRKNDDGKIVKTITPFGVSSNSSNPPKRPESKSSNKYFHGPGRTLDGKTSHTDPESLAEPLPASNYHRTDPLLGDDEVVQVHSQAPPKELSFTFWSFNRDISEITPGFLCGYSYCPCCLGPCCSEERKRDWCKLLKTITFYLMIIQIILYLTCVSLSTDLDWSLSPDLDVLMKFGANGYAYLKKYLYHRLLSYNILHGSIIHICANTFSQFLFVLPMEEAWGIWKFLIMYVSTGIVGGLFSGIQKSSISVGASCSILGIMGGFSILIIIYWTRLTSHQRLLYLFWLMMTPFEFVATSFLPHVDWLGHLGGFLSGLSVAAIVFHGSASTLKAKRLFLIGGIIGLILCALTPLLIIYLQ